MRHRYQPVAAVGAPITYPAIVGPRHGLGVVRVLAFGFPSQVEAWVNDRRLESFLIQPLDAFFRIGGAQRQPFAVLDAMVEFAFCTSHLAHLRDRAEIPAAIDA